MNKKLTIFNFFDNEEFVKVNKDKAFTNEEKVALIIRSISTSLKDKFEVLNEIAKESSEELRMNIYEWIDMKHKQLEYIKNLKIDNDISCLRIIKEHCYITPFSSFEDSLTNPLYINDGYISFYSSKLHKKIISVYTKKSLFFDNKKMDYLDFITNIDFFTKCSECNSLNDCMSDIYKYTVELNTPFKPFDYVYAPTFSDFTNYFVVGDKNDPDVKKTMQKEEYTQEKVEYLRLWLKLNTPNYFLETNSCGGHNVKAGEVTQSYIHEWERCRLANIKIYKPIEITVGTKNYINEIKRQLEIKYHGINGIY